MGTERRAINFSLLIFLLIFFFLPGTPASVDNKKDKREDSAEEYFRKWLSEDVVYIITPEERSVFNALTTPEERQKFIEQFWLRRDPTASTSINEFKEEYYRRIAYVNERFGSGRPGWKSDRGRTYITFGPPDEIESHPAGGSYQRKPWEGGGTTSTYPFEVWRYRHISGIGSDVEIEFVDPSWSGEYRMALSPEEKDALLHVPGAGLKTMEELGMASKLDRSAFSPGNANDAAYSARMGMRAKDMPFARLEQYFALQRPPEIKFKDLKTAVETHVTYNLLPFRMSTDFIRLGPDRILVPITLEIENGHLQFKKELDVYRGIINAYGIVTALNGRVVAEFEDVISTNYTEVNYPAGRLQKSIYQKVLMFQPGLYKLDVILKDVNSGNLGSSQSRLTAPRYGEGQLASSSLILARSIQPLSELPNAVEMFVLGNMKVVPNVEGNFPRRDRLEIYLQVYNAALDQSTLQPSLEVEYAVLKGDQVIKKIDDIKGSSVEFFSDERVVLVQQVSLADLEVGDYRLKVTVRDHINGSTLTREARFKVHA
ncbi:MAG: GWxTD domain-containing protein [Acidobacteria bacterium]|nr:GWxTD domain-containing protein [Acidobacteriota bacterium]